MINKRDKNFHTDNQKNIFCIFAAHSNGKKISWLFLFTSRLTFSTCSGWVKTIFLGDMPAAILACGGN